MPKNRDEKFLVAVGDRMRGLRQWHNMTLQEVAQRVDVAWQQIQKYETGCSDAPTGTLVRIADALYATPNDLLLGKIKKDNDVANDIDRFLSDPGVASIVRSLRAMDTPKIKVVQAFVSTLDHVKI